MPRKVLYSSRYGIGWVSNCDENYTAEQRRFMLEYPPFIEAIEKITEEHGGYIPSWDRRSLPLHPPVVVKDQGMSYRDIPAYMPVDQFIADWGSKFPGVPLPHLGAIPALEVEEVPDGSLVKVVEICDGKEDVEWEMPKRSIWL